MAMVTIIFVYNRRMEVVKPESKVIFDSLKGSGKKFKTRFSSLGGSAGGSKFVFIHQMECLLVWYVF